MIDRAHPSLSVSRQCHLLEVSRASVYRRPAPVSADDLRLMELIDRQYLAFYGSRRMTAWLATQGHPVNRKRVQRLTWIMHETRSRRTGITENQRFMGKVISGSGAVFSSQGHVSVSSNGR